jgi:signal transduction histidine kinase
MEEARSVLEHIVADGKRAGEIIGRVRALTKRQMPRMELLDVNRKVRQVVELAEDELRTRAVVLHTEFDPTLPGVAGDRVQLQQVMLNLILNATEAMSGIVDRPRELTIVTARIGASEVLVEVRDSGHGVAPDRVEQIFESFYTTKPEGIGIGLSISRSIVEAHGGRLWASSNQPQGAVFRLSLPIAQAGTV